MLPTTGYFKDIDCPYYDTSCGRPYCHFRHRKKNQDQESSEDTQETQESSESIPDYKPTPKSELAYTKSHIPIRYVPDIVVKSDRRPIRTFNFADRPTYKPTPISLLSSTNVSKDAEYKPASVSLENSQEEKEIKNDETNTDDLDLEKLSMEFDMIDEILSDSNTTDVNGSNKTELDTSKGHKNYKGKKSQSKNKSEGDSKSSELKEKKDDRHRKDKYSRSKSSKSSHRDKEKESSKDKTKAKEKTSEKSKEKDKHKTKEKEKIKETEKSKDKNEKCRSKSKEYDKRKDKSKENEKIKDKSKENEKSKSKTKERDKSKERDKEKDRKSEKSKKESHHKSRSSSSKTSNTKSKDKHKKEANKVRLESTSSSDDHNGKIEHDLSSYSYNFHESEEDEDNFDSIEQECYKIFNEYVPPIVSSGLSQDENLEGELPEPQVYIPTKKRIAHDNANQISTKVLFTKTNPVPNVALMLNQRIKIAKQQHAENEELNLIKEMNNQNLKRAIPENKPEVKKRKISLSLYKSIKSSNENKPKPISLVDEILNLKTKPIRIAPVQNVNSIQKAKAKIQEQIKNIKPVLKTQAQTVSRGSKRTAHVPDDSLCDLPDVIHAESSKLPVNVRTRYLTMLADECVKLYVHREDAHQRALNEEFKCYEKCSALVTYRNSAMLAVNRIRKEVKERENSGLGPIQNGESSKSNANSPFEGEAFYNNILQYVLTEEELVLHGYPRESSVPGRAEIHSDKPVSTEPMDLNERLCCRCHKLYQVDDYGFPLVQQDCIYHPLRKRTLRGERTYLCCKSTEDIGCVVSKTHVSEVLVGTELDGYQSTMDPEKSNDPRSTAVYALDCEMCYTIVGLELTRVTIVDTNLKTVYETLVKPLNPIIDYNTRFSGITKEQMDRTSTSILQVQANILHLCNSKTILIGHSLESDMKALKIIHSMIIDTSVMFPHKLGLPHKRALRMLASEYLRKIIQNDVGGHDSAEDALACMELVLWKTKEDLKVKNVK